MILNRSLVAFILSLYCLRGGHTQDYGKETNKLEAFSWGWTGRIDALIVGYYEDISRKTDVLHSIRFAYEESPQYEIGYLMGELVDRYRRMVDYLKRLIMFKSDAVFVTIKKISHVQMLYFEIYHLVNMMHEIPRKYRLNDDLSKPPGWVDSVQKVAPEDNKKAKEAQEKLIQDQAERQRRKKQKLREMKKMRELMLKGQYHTEMTRRPKNRWWPIDYGWEIDYYW